MAPHPSPPTPETDLSADTVGSLLVSMLAVAMVVAPAVSWMLGEELHTTALGLRAMVSLMALLLAWMPLPAPAAWRRMLGVSVLAAHHVGVGVAVGLPMTLFVELLVGTVFIGGLACWLLPRAGFGAILGVTLSVGTIGLGWVPPGVEPTLLALWAGVFLLGGAAAELSVWIGPRVRPPGDHPPSAGAPPTPPPTEPSFATRAGWLGLGVARAGSSTRKLEAASPCLQELLADWTSPTAWWEEVLDRHRRPQTDGPPTEVELYTPNMTRRRSFRLWSLSGPPGPTLVVQDITALTNARRTVAQLERSLSSATSEAENARNAHIEALRSRSHHLRTPLSNLMSSLELVRMSAEEEADPVTLREDLDAADEAAGELLNQLNALLAGIVADSHGTVSTDRIDVVSLVDSTLDQLDGSRSFERYFPQPSLTIEGPRAELTSMVEDAVRRAIVATMGTTRVAVTPTGTGEVAVTFQGTGTDGERMWTALRDLSPRVSALGGRLDIGGGIAPALVLPARGNSHAFLEDGATWSERSQGDGQLETLPPAHRLATEHENEPTHVTFARRHAMKHPS